MNATLTLQSWFLSSFCVPIFVIQPYHPLNNVITSKTICILHAHTLLHVSADPVHIHISICLGNKHNTKRSPNSRSGTPLTFASYVYQLRHNNVGSRRAWRSLGGTHGLQDDASERRLTVLNSLWRIWRNADLWSLDGQRYPWEMMPRVRYFFTTAHS